MNHKNFKKTPGKITIKQEKIKTNWLWDSRLSEAEAGKILKQENDPRFDLYAENLSVDALKRVADTFGKQLTIQFR